MFSGTAQFSKVFLDGNAGSEILRNTMSSLPKYSKPVLCGLTCGIVVIAFPQILFFGYETLNELLAEDTLPTELFLILLIVKIFTTDNSAGSGIVGGTFAPSLFLGGMVGASFHNIIADLLQIFQNNVLFSMFLNGSSFELADVPAYAMVGAASVLAALFKAPLTESLLLFELTRDYDVILPLLASAGVGSLIGEVVEQALEEARRELDAVFWGDLADDEDSLGSNL